MNYEKTFAIVAKMTIIHALITVTFVCQWFSYEIILLNGELKEKVYMVPSTSIYQNLREVCKLKKTLYGLK